MSINGLNLYAYCINDPVYRFDPSGKTPILSFFYISKEVIDKILIVAGVILVIIAIYVLEKETHFISNSVIAIKNMIEDVTTDIHDLIKTYFSELLTKNDYQNQREDHHIVAKSDYRAWFSWMILAECGIGLNDGINLVSVKKHIIKFAYKYLL